MNYNIKLDTNNISLQSILNTINALPDAESGGIDTSDATATSEDVMLNQTFYASNEKKTGTFTIDSEISTQKDLISQLNTILEGKANSEPSDGITLPILTNPASSSEILNGYEAIDQNGNIITGIMPMNVKMYEITLTKSSGWVLLTTLDNEVLEHINDINLTVSLFKTSEFITDETYALTGALASNNPVGTTGTYPIYGLANRQTSSSYIAQAIYYPPNKTDTSVGLGGLAMFRINGSSYYIRPGDGFIQSGTYRLTFTW